MLECYIPPSEAVIEALATGQTKDGLFARGNSEWTHLREEGTPPLNLAELHGPGSRKWGVDWVGNEGDDVLLHAGTYRISGWVAGEGATCKVTYENGRITGVEVEATGPGFSVAVARIKSDYSPPVCLRLHFLLASDSRDEVALDFLELGSYGSKLLFRPEKVQIRQYQLEEKGVPLGFRSLPQEVEAFAQSKLATPQAAAETPEAAETLARHAWANTPAKPPTEEPVLCPQCRTQMTKKHTLWWCDNGECSNLQSYEQPPATEQFVELSYGPKGMRIGPARELTTAQTLRVGDEFHYADQLALESDTTRTVRAVHNGLVYWVMTNSDGFKLTSATSFSRAVVVTKRASEPEAHGHPGHPTPTGIDWDAAGKRGMGPEGAKMRQALYNASGTVKGYAGDYSVPDVTKQGGYAEPMPSAEQVKSLALLRSIDQRLYELTMGLGPALCRKCREHAVIEQYTGPLELNEDGDPIQEIPDLEVPQAPSHARVTRKATGCWCAQRSMEEGCKDQQCPNAPDVLEACAKDDPGAVPVKPFTVELVGFAAAKGEE